ncbi:shikimate dehydrogenase [Paucibacter sp. XJ19-41]|nr:shikimate dehydrogenase [Paucibacter sp. XJ19-41]MDC6170868.1 shikimate dehydrogenase [Paucibacter sp. XJ19-41]
MSTAPIDRYAVAGNPVAHSRSPDIHAMFAAQTGEQLVYERLLCPLDGFEASLRGFAAAGGRGCNVTVPFKFEAHDLAARRSPRAALAGAVNVLRFDTEEQGGWFGDNSDGLGLVRDIEHNAARPLAGQRVLLLGAGGASAGVLGSLIAARPAEIHLANRSADKAHALVESHADWAARHGVRLASRRAQPRFIWPTARPTRPMPWSRAMPTGPPGMACAWPPAVWKTLVRASTC